jgi:hypothetical protein
MICHVCDQQAIGQCKSCGKFYCKEHGDVYCVRCSSAVKSPGQALEREVEFGASPEPEAGAPRCYVCPAVADRACRTCGRFFCPQHGDVSSSFGGPEMPLCTPCREKRDANQMWGCIIAVIVVVASLIIGIAISANAHR